MQERSVLNLSGYRFIALDDLPVLQADLHAALAATGVLGTVLLAGEGINVALAGSRASCEAARAVLDADPRLAGLWLKESRSETVPFARLKVRVRREIIAFDGDQARARQAARPAAPALPPETLRRWLDEGRELTLLDTRNAYEIASGSFATAEHLDLGHFRDFGAAVGKALADGRLDPAKPVVTFCTGGVRCEKAAPWLLEHGFEEVWQVEGGVLNWFERCGDAHWRGDCFVFDDRVEIDSTLAPTGATLCTRCQRAVPAGSACDCTTDRPSKSPGDDFHGRDDGPGDSAADAQPSRTAIDTV